MPLEALHLVDPSPRSGNAIAAGRHAWDQYKSSQTLAFSQLMDLGRALLVGRKLALEASGSTGPFGRSYITEFCTWCARTGFDDVPTNRRMDLLWCAENEDEVLRNRAEQKKIRARGDPSVNPRSMRAAVMRRRKVGPPRRRTAPTVGAMAIDILCTQLAGRLAAQPADPVLADVAALAAVLEDATRAVVANI